MRAIGESQKLTPLQAFGFVLQLILVLGMTLGGLALAWLFILLTGNWDTFDRVMSTPLGVLTLNEIFKAVSMPVVFLAAGFVGARAGLKIAAKLEKWFGARF